MKHKIVLYLTFCLFLSMSAFAAEVVTVDGLKYELNGTEASVSGYVGNPTDVVIPKSVTYNGNTYPVTSIGYGAFENCTGLTSITIPNSVTSIGYFAFEGCTGLKNVRIEDGKKVLKFSDWRSFLGITYKTFANCPITTLYLGRNLSYEYSPFQSFNTLKDVTIGNSVTSIGNSAFSGCDGLTSVTIGNSVTSIGESAFLGCSGLTSVTIPNCVTSIEGGAFYECSGLTSITIPNSVTYIGDNAFYDCTGLTSIAIPNSVTSIGNQAFEGCTGLKNVRIEDGENVLKISDTSDYKTFANCPITSLYLGRNLTSDRNYSPFAGINTLKEVTIGNNVTSIGNFAFSGCTGLMSITIPNSVTSIDRGAFFNTAWYNNQPDGLVYAGNVAYKYKGTMPSNTSITIKEGTNSITPDAFEGCKGLTSITIPNSVTSIGDYAFSVCSGLTSVTIGNSVTSIGGSAFSYCSGLTSVTIGNSVTSIGGSAFSYCSGLTSVTIPNSVTSIGNFAFEGCKGLTSITIPNSVTSIGNQAFKDCTGLTSITIPNSVTYIGYGAFSNTAWYNNQPDGLVYAGNVAYQYKGTMPDNTDIVIEEGTTVIAAGAFFECTGLASVTIPNSIMSIWDWGGEVPAFGHYYPGYKNFNRVYVTDLTAWCKIKFSSGDSNPLFWAHHLYLNGEEVKELIVPDGVTSINDYAFYGCKGLTSITIPNSVTSIGGRAFKDCTSVTRLISYAAIPPVCDYLAFDGINKQNCILSVPEESVSMYKQADQWKEFFFIESIPAGIHDISLDNIENATIYDLNGRKMKEPHKGFNIIDGKKVMVK